MAICGTDIGASISSGIILSLHLQKGGEGDLYRLFAPTSAHTISKESRRRRTCYLNSVTLGYGRGELTMDKNGVWTFLPRFKNKLDEHL